jgi:serine/threonine-protein kinase
VSFDKDPLIGTVLGDYTINRLIARGGMGRVYEATDTNLDRKVAVKVITLDEEEAAELMERFQREGRVIGQLDDHPNIVTIYRYGTAQGVHYIAMKYIQGVSLADHMKSLRDKAQYLDFHQMLTIMRQVAEALDYAHQHGVIHRDVKPANVMLEPHQSGDPLKVRAILMDFGLVMRVDTTVTTGTAFGTPLYISPEQAMSSQEARAQSDIYSLGVVTYEILAGRPPFDDRDSPIAVALSHVTKAPDPPTTWRKDLPPGIDAVMMKVLDKEPNNRYQRAIDFVEALEGVFAVKATPLAASPPLQVPPIPREPSMERPPTPAPKKAAKKKGKQQDKRRSARSGRGDHILPSLILFVLLIGVAALAFIIITGEGQQEGEAT